MSKGDLTYNPFQRLAAIIPAFNEARSIETVVREVSLRAMPIVVDDGSNDETSALARVTGAYVVSHPTNRGYDAALETGLQAAQALGCTFAVTIDADGQHSPTLIDRYIEDLEGGADLVVGNRDDKQRWSEALFSIIGRVLWGLNDPTCGMKGYRLTAVELIKCRNTYNSIGTELALRMTKCRVRVTQPRIKTCKREGRSRFGGGMNANLMILRALWLGIIRL